MSECTPWERGAPSIGPAVVAIGVFDGVHLGHQALISDAADSAQRRSVPCVALTFDRDPDQVVTPDAPSPQLLSLADKCHFLKHAGADIVSVIPFDTATASMLPEEFVERILLAACTPQEIHVGVDFRFGRFAEGNVSSMQEIGSRAGFRVAPHDLVTLEERPITSTRIRSLVSEGLIEMASHLLGRPHRVTGMVVKGRGEGRSVLGIPTANILPLEHAALPLEGVYAGRARTAEGVWPAAISVGVPPTFPLAHHVLEVHLIGFEGDLLHADLTIEFAHLIRPQRSFESTQELADAMRADIARIASIMNGSAVKSPEEEGS